MYKMVILHMNNGENLKINDEASVRSLEESLLGDGVIPGWVDLVYKKRPMTLCLKNVCYAEWFKEEPILVY